MSDPLLTHPFVKTLLRVNREGHHFQNAAKVLEEQIDDLRLKINKHQLENSDHLKVYVINTLRAIREEEKKIWETHDQAYIKQQDIQSRMRKVRAMNDSDQYDYWYRISEYYGEAINQIDDAKYTIMEYLATYYPEECARNENNLELVKSILPAWNLARRKVLSLSKSRIINKTKSARGGSNKGENNYQAFKLWISKTKFPLLDHKSTARVHLTRLLNDKGFEISEKTAYDYRKKYLDETKLGK